MADNAPGIATAQRTALLRHGVVVLESELDGPRPRIVVSGAGRERVETLVAQHEHVDDIVVAEDDSEVVIFATVCTAVVGEKADAWEGPWHVYLDRPLGDRKVFDGSAGTSIPYVNVYDRLRDDRAGEEASPGGAHVAEPGSSRGVRL